MPNSIDKAIAYAFPGWALNRANARKVLALYDGGRSNSSGRMQRHTDSGNADFAAQLAGREMVRQAREFEQNYDVAKGAFDLFESRIIGSKLQTQPLVRNTQGNPHKEFNEQVKYWYDQWFEDCDIAGELHGGLLQRLSVRSWMRDGEILCRTLEGRAYPHLSPVPFSLEMIECDQLPYEDGKYKDNRIIQGVEKGKFNRPVAYHILKQHPGDRYIIQSRETLRIPAYSMQHLKLVERIGQTRGITALHSTFKRFDDIRDYDESERIAAKMSAALGAQITKDPTMLTNHAGYKDSGQRRFGFKPGMFWDNLDPGEKIEPVNANGRPNPQLEAFRRGQMRMVARGLNLSYSSMMGEFSGTYSAERQALVESYMGYIVMADSFTNSFWHKIYCRFVETLILYDFVQIPPDVDRNTLFKAAHVSPEMPYIDPVKEIKAKWLKLKSRLTSISELQRAAGSDPEDVFNEIARDMAILKTLGIPVHEIYGEEPSEGSENIA